VTNRSRHDRRTFLKTGVAWGSLLAGSGIPFSFGSPKSRVFLARDSALRSSSGAFESGRVFDLLDRAMLAFSDTERPVEAWRQFVEPGQVVGLKVNCLAGRGMSTSSTLVEAVNS